MINEIMNKNIIFGDCNNSIKEIANLMKKNNIGFIPIKENEEFIGVITDRDICLAIPTLKTTNDSVKPYITKNIIYVDINSSVNNALSEMKKHKIKRLLVKEKDNITGVLSLSDILNCSNNEDIANTCKTIFSIHDNNCNDTPEVDKFYL